VRAGLSGAILMTLSLSQLCTGAIGFFTLNGRAAQLATITSYTTLMTSHDKAMGRLQFPAAPLDHMKLVHTNILKWPV